jgi:hypothetical protein
VVQKEIFVIYNYVGQLPDGGSYTSKYDLYKIIIIMYKQASFCIVYSVYLS